MFSLVELGKKVLPFFVSAVTLNSAMDTPSKCDISCRLGLLML